MRIFILSSLFCFNLFAGEVPSLKYRYAAIFDMWCSNTTKIQITMEERQELIKVFPMFQREWDKLGSKLLNKTANLFKKPFHQKDLEAGVFLCKKTPSMGFPLMINTNWFVGKNPKDPKQIVYITYHEVLHSYLQNNFPGTWTTALAKKHQAAGASMRVLAHLHLMAMQEYVFTKMGLKDELSELIELEQSYNHAGYKEAWKIVKKEGHMAFIKELLAM